MKRKSSSTGRRKANLSPNDSQDWEKALKPIFDEYGKRKHPLDYKNKYQLVIMVVLSARDSDKHINSLAAELFKKFPSMKELSRAEPEDLYPCIGSVTNFPNKAKWIITIAKTVRDDDHIPSTLEELTALPGIGRKSANVIISESGGKAEGVIVDLHVLRVAPRLGIAKGTNPQKVEEQIMEKVPQKYWRAAGMGMSFLGREVCRPTNPHCEECVVNKVCEYYASLK
jgi:endonuclease-3